MTVELDFGGVARAEAIAQNDRETFTENGGGELHGRVRSNRVGLGDRPERAHDREVRRKWGGDFEGGRFTWSLERSPGVGLRRSNGKRSQWRRRRDYAIGR